MIGQPHSYICQAVAKYAEHGWAEFLKSRPTMTELRRASQDSATIKSIVKYCDDLDDDGKVAEKVVRFLFRVDPLVKDIGSIVDRKYREGLINVPVDFLTSEGLTWFRARKD